MRRLNPKYILLISDAAIPLLGFFFWHWNLYFILLFYILDLLAREVITHVKSRKIIEQRQMTSRRKWYKNGLLSALLLLGVFGGIHAAMWFIVPGIDFGKELVNFWQYEEMGIQQGYLLLPLVGYAAYAQYKMEFLMTGKARTVLIDTLWRRHQQALIILIAGCVLSLALGMVIALPELVYVLAIVVGAAGYALFVQQK